MSRCARRRHPHSPASPALGGVESRRAVAELSAAGGAAVVAVAAVPVALAVGAA
jgi:hypothetical protein